MMTQQVEDAKPSVKVLISDNEKFVSQTRRHYNLFSDSLLISPKIKFTINDTDNNPIYMCKYNNINGSGALKDMNDNIIVEFKLKTGFINNELTIYNSDKGQTLVLMSQKKGFKKPKYNVNYYNRATGRTEVLDAQVVTSNGDMSVFREGGHLICTIHKYGTIKSTNYGVEIEPGVDHISMLLYSILAIRVLQNRNVVIAS